MESHFPVKFIRVEDWVKKVKKGRGINDETYLREAFQAIETGVRASLDHHSKIVFESTGLTNYFDQMLKSLQCDFNMITIKILADNALCLKRVKTRDSSIHINISDEEVNRINKQAQAKQISTDFCLDNTTKNIDELKIEIDTIIQKCTSIKQ